MAQETLTEREDELYVKLYKIRRLADEINRYIADLPSEEYDESPERPVAFEAALEDFIELAKDIYGYSSLLAEYLIGLGVELPADPTQDPVIEEEHEPIGKLFERLAYFRKVLYAIYTNYSDAQQALYSKGADGDSVCSDDKTFDNELNKAFVNIYDIMSLQEDILNFLRPGAEKENANN